MILVSSQTHGCGNVEVQSMDQYRQMRVLYTCQLTEARTEHLNGKSAPYLTMASTLIRQWACGHTNGLLRDLYIYINSTKEVNYSRNIREYLTEKLKEDITHLPYQLWCLQPFILQQYDTNVSFLIIKLPTLNVQRQPMLHNLEYSF